MNNTYRHYSSQKRAQRSQSDKSPMINHNRKSTSDLSRGEFDSIDPRINSSAEIIEEPMHFAGANASASTERRGISIYYRSRTALARKSPLMESIRRELILTDLLTRLL